MKKLSYLFSLLLTANFIFISCNSDDDLVTDGVLIGGARWATRNVGAPGTFVANPEDAGMLFQWNRRQGWTVGNTEGWDNTSAEGTVWAAENDPCPPGWRVPTYAELRNLNFVAGGSSYTKNGVEGRLFGSAPNQIFLPIVRSMPQVMVDGSILGLYWSSTQNDSNTARTLHLNSRSAGTGSFQRFFTFPIRCVAR